MKHVFGFDESDSRVWRGGVNWGLSFLIREVLMKCFRTSMITERSALIVERSVTKIGADFEPQCWAVSQIGLVPAGFMGSGFAGGAQMVVLKLVFYGCATLSPHVRERDRGVKWFGGKVLWGCLRSGRERIV